MPGEDLHLSVVAPLQAHQVRPSTRFARSGLQERRRADRDAAFSSFKSALGC